MHIKTKQNRALVITVLISLLLVAVTAAVVWMLFLKDPTDRFEPKYQQVDEHRSANTENPTEKVDQGDQNSLPETSNEVPGSTTGSISITELDQSRGFINIAVDVSSFETTRCVYIFTSDGARPVVRELSRCEKISIPEIEFEKIGMYTLTVTAYDSEKKIEAKRDINIR